MKLLVVVALLTAGIASLVASVGEQTVSAIPAAEEIETTAPRSSNAAIGSQVDDAESPTTMTAATPSTMAATAGHGLTVPEAVSPIRLRVERLGLDLDIDSVGVDAEGDFDVPRSGVGWYRYGVSPGEEGSAVLAAHVDFNGSPGAFFELDALLGGDRIEIDLSDGTTSVFEVVEQILYDKTALPADELFAEEGDATLRLITCGGTFDHAARSYQGNRVVTALPVLLEQD